MQIRAKRLHILLLRSFAGPFAMTFLIVVSALLFTSFVTLARLPQMLISLIVGANLPVMAFLIIVMLMLVFLGCFIDAMSMTLLVLPILLPVLQRMGVDLIWFGILFIKTAEVGAITPPFGMGVYVLKGAVGDKIPISTIFRGIIPFILMDILTLAILMAFPLISLWLPNTMKG